MLKHVFTSLDKWI